MNGSRPPRARTTTRQPRPGGAHPIGTPNQGLSPNTGPLASARWLVARDLFPKEPKWFVEVMLRTADAIADLLDEGTASQARIEIYAEEWGFAFRHAGKLSWIRVTDVPFVHGRDEHELLGEIPPLADLGALVRVLEDRHGLRFDRAAPWIRTSLVGAEPTIREWIASL